MYIIFWCVSVVCAHLCVHAWLNNSNYLWINTILCICIPLHIILIFSVLCILEGQFKNREKKGVQVTRHNECSVNRFTHIQPCVVNHRNNFGFLSWRWALHSNKNIAMHCKNGASLLQLCCNGGRKRNWRALMQVREHLNLTKNN